MLYARLLLVVVVSGCAGAYIEARAGMSEWTLRTGGGFCPPSGCPPELEWSRPSYDASLAIGVFVDEGRAALHVGRSAGTDRSRYIESTYARVDVSLPVTLPYGLGLRPTAAYASTTPSPGSTDERAGRDRFLGATLSSHDHDLAATLGLRSADSTDVGRKKDARSHVEARYGFELRVMARLSGARIRQSLK